MKTTYYFILFCFCIFTCYSQTEKNGVNNMEKFNLNLSFYPSRMPQSIVYSIDIINDSLIIKTNWRIGNKEYRGKLTNSQYSEVKKTVSTLTQKYDRTDSFARDAWGCMLKVDNQIYYEDNFFSLTSISERIGWQSPPKEIKLLIDYVVSLSPIPIELFSFS